MAKRPGTAEAGRMSAADLAAKKLLLPFIDELSFIEISLAEVTQIWEAKRKFLVYTAETKR